MAKGAFKQKLGLLDLSLLGIGSIIGSGWLYAALTSAGYAGAQTGWAWILGAIIVLPIGLVFAELSAAIPRAGGLSVIPTFPTVMSSALLSASARCWRTPAPPG